MSTTATKKHLKYGDYRVALICPQEVELSAVWYMLDEEHTRLASKKGDSNRYIFGEMSGHNVVIGFLPQGSQGVGEAARVATDMKRTFPEIKLRLLVGTGGGVPSSTNDIRLGDVVIGMPEGIHGGVVQYDLGKDTVAGFERKGFLNPPPTVWRNAVVEMRGDHRTKTNRIDEFISTMTDKYPQLALYGHPGQEKDVLFLPNNEHLSGEATCDNCNKRMVVDRPDRSSNHPKLFYGLIASGHKVENANTRDQISREAGGALCFEMEAAGLMNDFHCVVIRGIADYADSHQYDEWHAYAAAVAAGCAKELLTYMDTAIDLPAAMTDQELLEKTAELYRRVLKVGRTTLGEEHSARLVSINNLAAVLENQGRHEEAENLLLSAIASIFRSLDQDMPTTKRSTRNLVDTQGSQIREEETMVGIVDATTFT